MTEQVSFQLRGRNPDVLTCIANLSNDEVFTPPELANRMLDTLAEAWAADNKTLSGRSEQISTSGGVASTYACYNCCPDSVYQTSILPSSIEMLFGASEYLQGQQTDMSCNGTPFGPYVPTGLFWNSDNVNVVTVDGGQLYAAGVGNATISAVWETCLYWFDGGTCTPVCEQNIEYAPVSVTNPQPTISEIGTVEKNGLRPVNVSVTGAGGNDTTIFRLRRTSGTGSATFEDGTTEKSYSGNLASTELKIKGVTESSAANNYVMEAVVNGTTHQPSAKTFTVAMITSLVFERLNTTGGNPDVPLDNNPGIDGMHTQEEGQRVYPDKNVPGSEPDRSTLRIRATVAPASIPNVRVYFASFDLDDPSAAGLPIDSTPNGGVDNNGTVNRVANGSRSGEFSNAAGVTCSSPTAGASPLHVSKIDCPVTDSSTSTNFKVTMQPGDNFAVGASLVGAYRDEMKLDSSGANLINNASQVIPITGEENTNNVQGLRTKMLTVWRRVHLEIDRMNNVPSTVNRESGNITAGGAANIPPGPYNLGVSNALDLNRFENGRIEIAGVSYQVVQNNASVVQIQVLSTTTINNGASYTLYDDDDYNDDDGTNVDGDSGEPTVELGDTFSFMTDQDGNHGDGRPRNVYRSAYVTPTRNWAENVAVNYIQTNVTFNLNVAGNIAAVLNANRNSLNDESNEFWVGYLLVAYQGATDEDADGYRLDPITGTFVPEGGVGGIAGGATSHGCDCRQAPCMGTVCPVDTSGATIFPDGADGALVFQEVMQDVRKTWLRALSITTRNVGSTAPHELGHQFGLRGDNDNPTTSNGLPRRTSNTYLLMDYVNYQTETQSYGLHPEHINLIRMRVGSPGQ